MVSGVELTERLECLEAELELLRAMLDKAHEKLMRYQEAMAEIQVALTLAREDRWVDQIEGTF